MYEIGRESAELHLNVFGVELVGLFLIFRQRPGYLAYAIDEELPQRARRATSQSNNSNWSSGVGQFNRHDLERSMPPREL